MYLLDTNVVSELRRTRPHGGVLAWLGAVADQDLHIAAVTIGEIQAGIEITRQQDPARAAEIEAWLGKVVETYNVLAADAVIFRAWARVMHHRTNDLIEDALIAATAIVHKLTIVTRNETDFFPLGVAVYNPFSHAER